MKALLLWLKANPVAVTDGLKALTALLAALGVPVTSGLSAAVGAFVIVLLSLWTQYAVGAKVEEALNTPVPDPEAADSADPDVVADSE